MALKITVKNLDSEIAKAKSMGWTTKIDGTVFYYIGQIRIQNHLNQTKANEIRKLGYYVRIIWKSGIQYIFARKK